MTSFDRDFSRRAKEQKDMNNLGTVFANCSVSDKFQNNYYGPVVFTQSGKTKCAHFDSVPRYSCKADSIKKTRGRT